MGLEVEELEKPDSIGGIILYYLRRVLAIPVSVVGLIGFLIGSILSVIAIVVGALGIVVLIGIGVIIILAVLGVIGLTVSWVFIFTVLTAGIRGQRVEFEPDG